MSNIKKYKIEDTIISIEKKKNQMIKNCREMEKLFKTNERLSRSIGGFDPLAFKYNQYKHQDNYKKYINRVCWFHIIELFEMQQYMLCSDYEKTIENIRENKAPDFNRETVLGWVAGLIQLIHNNLNTLVKKVFSLITERGYYTGPGGYRATKKKRNNNGVDSFFIITTYDYTDIFQYRSNVTVTDDLEKCIYILAGRKLPEEPIKRLMRTEKLCEWENDLWKIKVCKNGNTHYWIKNKKILMLLNKIGSGKGTIGESARIKILEKYKGD